MHIGPQARAAARFLARIVRRPATPGQFGLPSRSFPVAAVLSLMLLASAAMSPAAGLDAAAGPHVSVQGIAYPGENVTFVGSGFRPASILQVRWDRQPTRLRFIKVNSSGRFVAGVRIPKTSTAGVHEVTFGKIRASITWSVAVASPPRLILHTPVRIASINVRRHPTPTPMPTPAPTATVLPVPTAVPTPAPTATPSAVTGTQWGLIGGYSGIDLADAYAHGVRVVLEEMSWASAEPSNGAFSASYFNSVAGEIARYRAAGLRVVLNFGMQHAPAWLLAMPNARYVDQYGATYTGSDEPNLIWNTSLRSYGQRFINQVFSRLGTNFVAVRVGGGHWGELTYPDRNYGGQTNAYWAFDSAAAASNPVPGWKPGNASPSGQAGKFINWYLNALTAYQNWQISAVRSAYPGTIAVLYPSWGLRSGDLTRAIADNLNGASSPEVNGEVQRGFDHSRHIAAVNDSNVAVWATWSESTGTVSWLSSLATAKGLVMMGENSGSNTDTQLAAAMGAARTYHLKLLMWVRASDTYCNCNGYATISNYGSRIASSSP